MSAWVLLALSALDGGVALPLREAPPAPRLLPVEGAVSDAKPCTIETRRFEDARVKEQWLARCPLQQGAWLATERRPPVAVVGLFAQFWTDAVVAFRPGEATAFSRKQAPPWVSREVLQRLDAERAPGLPGFVRLGEDPRDGVVVGHSYERGYLRLEKEGPVPLFPTPPPPEANTPMKAVCFDADEQVRPPWLAWVPDPWRNVELRLRAPDGDERVLYQRPPRAHGGSYRVTLVDAARPAAQALPTVSLLADGDFLLFTPDAPGRGARYGVRGVPAPLVGEPPLPPGETGQPRAEGPPCSEVPQAVEEEALFDPRLVTWDGRTFLVFVSEVVRTARRFGPVPRAGKTPAEDRLTCGWIVDARRSEVSLVLGEVTATGAVKEHLRAAVDLVPSDGVHGLRNLVAVQGDELWVASSALGAFTFTRFDLAGLGAR